MPDSTDRQGTSTTPSDERMPPELDLDARLLQAEKAMRATKAETVKEDSDNDELDVDGTEAKEDDSDDAPEDLEDDELDADEVNTPDEDDEDEQEDLPESTESKPTKPEQKSVKAKAKGQDVDPSGLSRKQRGKLIEEIRQQLLEEQQQKEALQAQIAAMSAEDEDLEKDVNRALGTEKDFEQAMEDALNSDDEDIRAAAAERARIWKNNRVFYKKLVKKAKKETMAEFMDAYWKDLEGKPGITPELLMTGNLNELLHGVQEKSFEAGKTQTEAKIAELQDELDTWKAKFRTLKKKAAAVKRSPVASGGDPVVISDKVDWLSKYRDPKTGLLTDEAEKIVELYGFEGLRTGKKIKG